MEEEKIVWYERLIGGVVGLISGFMGIVTSVLMIAVAIVISTIVLFLAGGVMLPFVIIILIVSIGIGIDSLIKRIRKEKLNGIGGDVD